MGQRGIVCQWNGAPTVDGTNLKLLCAAYQKAVDPLGETGDIHGELHERICELAVTYNILLSRKTLEDLIDHLPSKKNPLESKAEHETRRSLLKAELDNLYRELDKEFDRLAELSRPPTSQEVKSRAEQLAEQLTKDKEQKDLQGKSPAILSLALQQLLSEKGAQKAQISQYRVTVADKIVRLTQSMCELPYIERYPGTGRNEHNLSAIEQAQAKIRALMELAHDPKYNTPWIHSSHCLTDVPKCACHVGHWHGCGCHVYVWVLPQDHHILRDFTIAILSLVPKETQETAGAGQQGSVGYSPTIAGGGR
jgi:hypothetical protein